VTESAKFAMALFFALFAINGETRADAAELVMLEQKGCSWCQRWRSEIGPAYHKTAEALIAPLRIVDIDQEWPADLSGIRRERFTPTFVLVENGTEIGRIRGYSGDEFFWFLLDEMLVKLADQPRSGEAQSGI
jgi:thioredoxin-related protein